MAVAARHLDDQGLDHDLPRPAVEGRQIVADPLQPFGGRGDDHGAILGKDRDLAAGSGQRLQLGADVDPDAGAEVEGLGLQRLAGLALDHVDAVLLDQAISVTGEDGLEPAPGVDVREARRDRLGHFDRDQHVHADLPGHEVADLLERSITEFEGEFGTLRLLVLDPRSRHDGVGLASFGRESLEARVAAGDQSVVVGRHRGPGECHGPADHGLAFAPVLDLPEVDPALLGRAIEDEVLLLDLALDRDRSLGARDQAQRREQRRPAELRRHLLAPSVVCPSGDTIGAGVTCASRGAASASSGAAVESCCHGRVRSRSSRPRGGSGPCGPRPVRSRPSFPAPDRPHGDCGRRSARPPGPANA